MMRKSAIAWFFVGWALVACGATQDIQGPRLVREVTLAPVTDALPTRFLSPTPPPVTQEIISPLLQTTLPADFVLVTPTLPPSKTPTLTPTMTFTPTATLTPTITATATSTAFLLPTSAILPVTSIVAAPINQICDSNWFFIQPRPASCPLNTANAGQGVYQAFERGFMVWVGSQDAIYILYSDTLSPKWEVHRDYFADGMPEFVTEFANAPSPNLWQPRRGFGMLWRADETLRNRMGWATMENEQPYSVQVQTANDGSIFVSAPTSNLFGLLASGVGWQLYSTTNNAPFGSPSGGGVPLPTALTP